MQLLRRFYLLFVVTVVWSQPNRSPTTPAPLTRSSFITTGLHNEKLLTNFFTGNFVDIPFDRENLQFSILFGEYIDAFGRHCDRYLPPNKVELTRQVCTSERYQTDRFGNRVGGSTCVAYRTEGRGIYADPSVYAFKPRLEGEQAVSVAKDALRLMTQKNPLQAALNTAAEAQQMTNDMNALVQRNACVNPGLKRFQENLMLFAMGMQPVLLPGAAPSVTSKAQSSPTGASNQNYTRLLEDLIAEQSKTWLMNRFVPGSTSNVVVSSRDASGRPSKIVGRYLFNGRSPGSVTLDFSDGVPECMYFFDLPSTCKTPNRRIVSAYVSGSYQQ